MLDQRFIEFKKSIKPSQFNDSVFLTKQSQALANSDPELANRIMLRVQNLEKQKNRRLVKKLQVKRENVDNKPVQKLELQTSTKVTKQQSEAPPLIGSLAAEIEINSEDEVASSVIKSKSTQLLSFIKTPFAIFVVLPVFIFSFYQIVLATVRYESQTQLIVQQPDGMTTMDAGMALLSGLGGNSTNSDTQLVQKYIYSNDMLKYLDDKLKLRQYYSSSNADFFSRLHDWDTQEDFYDFYQKHVIVEIDEKSSVITVFTQAFDPEFANQLAVTIAKKAEWFINDIGHQLANAQLKFIQEEHKLVEQRLQKAQSELIVFQQLHNLLNPEAEGSALAQIAYGMEGQIAIKQAELKALESIMSVGAPQVINAKNELSALKKQLKLEKERLTKTNGKPNLDGIEDELSVSEVLAKFADLKIELDLALKGFTSSTISLEKSRIEAYRQLKYLIIVENATMPEADSYPTVFYNIALLSIVLLLLYGIGRIVSATIQELK